MMRIDRAAWQRIKARVAGPSAAIFFKGRSRGATMGVLEQMLDLYDVAPPRLDETDAEFRARCVRRWNSAKIIGTTASDV